MCSTSSISKLSIVTFISSTLITPLYCSQAVGYDPADLTVHPPRTAEGGLIFFV